MSIERREAGISPEVIEKIPEVFKFKEQKPELSEFERRVQEYRDAQSFYQSLLELSGKRFQDAETPTQEAQKQREQLEARIMEARRQILRGRDDHNPERLHINLGRLGVRLQRPATDLSLLPEKIVPFLFRLLGGVKSEEHPYVSQVQNELTHALEVEAQARSDSRTKKVEIDREMQPQIAKSEREVVRKEDELLQYIGQFVSFSRPEMLKLAKLIPARREKVIDMYIASSAADSELMHFSEFLVETEEFGWVNKLPRHKKLWHGHQAWVEITRNSETDQDEVTLRPPTKEEFDALPPRVRYLWRGFLRERFLEDLGDKS